MSGGSIQRELENAFNSDGTLLPAPKSLLYMLNCQSHYDYNCPTAFQASLCRSLCLRRACKRLPAARALGVKVRSLADTDATRADANLALEVLARQHLPPSPSWFSPHTRLTWLAAWNVDLLSQIASELGSQRKRSWMSWLEETSSKR